MELFLLELETITKRETKTDIELNLKDDGINLITYIAALSEDISSNELENASKIVFNAITNTFKNSYEGFLKLLKENDQQSFLSLSKNNETFRVNVRSKWLFQVILLSAMKYLGILNSSATINLNEIKFLRSIVTLIIKYLSILKPASVHLLRTLLFVLNKQRNIFSPGMSLVIIENMNKVALSPIPYFKQYAHSISKIALPMLTQTKRKMFLHIYMLPVRGVDTIDVVKLFPQNFIKQNIKAIIRRVLKLFLKNVENKDGGILYESVLFYTFEEWKVEVWPLFLSSLESMEYEGEFFQSLLKYWIPSNVLTYRKSFYMFIKDQIVDKRLKAYVLVETKKKGFMDDILFDDIGPIAYDIDTASIGLKIVSIYHKKSLRPGPLETTIVLNYLHSVSNTALLDDEVKSLNLFFSQIFLHAHSDLKKSNESIFGYITFLENVYKYCFFCLETECFEVGAQILLLLTNIAKGSYKSLQLNYKVGKMDMYEEGENLLYKELQRENLWKLESKEFYVGLRKCFFRNNASGSNLTKLLVLYSDKTSFVDIKCFKSILEAETLSTLQNTERIKNYATIILKNREYSGVMSDFLIEIMKLLTDNLNSTKDNYFDEHILYKNVLFFEIILVATKNEIEIGELYEKIDEALDVVTHILENNFSGDGSYKTAKVLEAFINSIIYCIMENLDTLWLNFDKNKVVFNLIKIIQRSNMKRPVSLAVEVLKQFGAKMEEAETDKVFKIQFLEATLKSIYKNPVKQELKIRRNPESRLIIHALCSSEKHENKPLLKWTLNFLLDVIGNPESSDSSVSSALHSIEILASDESLHTDTLPFILEIFIKCVELFSKTNWIVRNADLQLAKALVERFYGVSLSLNSRPKNVENLFLLYPELSLFFFKILSLGNLDERSILVFQFFFESQVKEQLFENELTIVTRKCFLAVFSDIIKKYPNHYGNLAVRAYVSLCFTKEIPEIVTDITDYIKINFNVMQKNIFANFIFLLQELYEKYKTSYYYQAKQFLKINSALNELVTYLRKFDTSLYDFLLFKVKSVDSVLQEFEKNNRNENEFKKRLWIHNNLQFLFINARPTCIDNILNKIITNELMSCIQVKILSILVQRLENNDFNTEIMSKIVEILFKKSFLLDDSNNYLLNCYFKTALVFLTKDNNIKLPESQINYNHSDNLYKIMIYVLYFSKQKCSQNDFYKIVEAKYTESIGINDEVDNDLISSLRYFKIGAPKAFSPTIFKLCFYGAIRSSTYLEAYSFISWTTRRSYSSILSALNDFLSVKTLKEHLETEAMRKFFLDIDEFVDSLPDYMEENTGYYTVESDYIVSKLSLKKLLKRCITSNDS